MKESTKEDIDKQKRNGMAAILACTFSKFIFKEGSKRAAIKILPKVLTKSEYVKTRKRDFRIAKRKEITRDLNAIYFNKDDPELKKVDEPLKQPYHEFSKINKIDYGSLSYSRNFDEKVYRDLLTNIQSLEGFSSITCAVNNILHIDISGQHIGNQGLLKLVDGISQSNIFCIQSLTLTDNDLDDQVMKPLFGVLMSLKGLQKLFLNHNSITDDGIQHLFGLDVSYSSLEVVNLSRNPVGVRTAYLIGSLFASTRPSKLHSVFFGDKLDKCSLGDDFLSVFVSLVTTPGAKPLRRFSFSNGGLTRDGIFAASALLLCSTTLEELNLTRNSISDPLARKIFSRAVEVNNSLSALNIRQCGLASDAVVRISRLAERRNVSMHWHDNTFIATILLQTLSRCDRTRIESENYFVNILTQPVRRPKQFLPTRNAANRPPITRIQYDDEVALLVDNYQKIATSTQIVLRHPQFYAVEPPQIFEEDSEHLDFYLNEIMQTDDVFSAETEAASRRISALLHHTQFDDAIQAAAAVSLRLSHVFVKENPPANNSHPATVGNVRQRSSVSILPGRANASSTPETGATLVSSNEHAPRLSIAQLLDQQPVVPAENSELHFVPRQYDEAFMSALNKDLKRNSIHMRRSVYGETHFPENGNNLGEIASNVSKLVLAADQNQSGIIFESLPAHGDGIGGELSEAKDAAIETVDSDFKHSRASSGREKAIASSAEETKFAMHVFKLPEVEVEMHSQIIRRAAQKHLEVMDPLEMSVMMALVVTAMKDCNKFRLWLRHVELVAMETIISCIVDLPLEREEKIYLKRSKAACKTSKRQAREVRKAMQISLNKLNTQVHARLAALGMDMTTATTLDNTVTFDMVLMAVEDYRSCLLEESIKQECGLAAAHRYRLARREVAAVDAKEDIAPYIHWMPYAHSLGDGAYFAHAYFVARPHESNQLLLQEKKRLEELAASEKESKRPVRISPALRRERTREKMQRHLASTTHIGVIDSSSKHAPKTLLPPLGLHCALSEASPSEVLDVEKLLSNEKVHRNELAPLRLEAPPLAPSRGSKYKLDPLPSVNEQRKSGVTQSGVQSFYTGKSSRTSMKKEDSAVHTAQAEASSSSHGSRPGLLSVYVPSSHSESNPDDGSDVDESNALKLFGKGRRERRYFMENGLSTQLSVVLEQEEDRGRPLQMHLRLNYFGKNIRREKRLNLMFRKQVDYYKSWDVYNFEDE